MTNKPRYKWFCQCRMENDEKVFLVAHASTSKEASDMIHEDYAIAYIEDILTPLEMTLKKMYLAPTLVGGAVLHPWWTSAPKQAPKPPTKQPKTEPALTVLYTTQTEMSVQAFDVMPLASTMYTSLDASYDPHAERARTRPPVRRKQTSPTH